jgi:hypothetical protein
MLEQPTQEIELTAEQRRNLGHVYRMILGWRKDRKNKATSQPASESSSEEHSSLQTKSDSAEQTESES